jgi:DNA-directed RNA polymerase subunit RPC12/RpoP
MDLNDQFELEHLFFSERKCRACGKRKNLTDGFYKIRKNNTISSSYAYECKECTIKRITESRKKVAKKVEWEYPDW